jgi:hypothetical protein
MANEHQLRLWIAKIWLPWLGRRALADAGPHTLVAWK